MTAEYDVAIIGGGLAGLASAILLKKSGHRVLLVEKRQYPFHKVCGEYISLESWEFLTQLGLPLAEMELPIIKHFRLTTSSRKMDSKLPLGGFGISRYTLDANLFDIAEKAGVEVWQDTQCKAIHYKEEQDLHAITTSLKRITAKVVLGSFGKRSNLDKQLKRPFAAKAQPLEHNYVGIKYHMVGSFPSDLIELHLFPNGYCGISQVDEQRYCLCYLTLASNLTHYKGDIPAMEQGVLHQNPHLAERMEGFTSAYEQPLAISQVVFKPKEKIAEHVLMLGDAAGMITPLTGNGMSIALHTAKLASETVESYLNQKLSRLEMESQYTRLWQKQFGKRIWAGRTFHKMFYHPASANITMATIGQSAFLRAKLISLTHGKSF